MSQVHERDGVVIRGANGHLWVVRDPSRPPERVSDETAAVLNPLIDRNEFEKAREELHKVIAWGCVIRGQFIDLPGFGKGA